MKLKTLLPSLALLLLAVPTTGFAQDGEKDQVKVPGFGKMAKWVKGNLERQNREEVRVELSRKNRGQLGDELCKSFEASLKAAGVKIVTKEEGGRALSVEMRYLRSGNTRVAMDLALKSSRNQELGKFSSNFTLPDGLLGGDVDALVASE